MSFLHYPTLLEKNCENSMNICWWGCIFNFRTFFFTNSLLFKKGLVCPDLYFQHQKLCWQRWSLSTNIFFCFVLKQKLRYKWLIFGLLKKSVFAISMRLPRNKYVGDDEAFLPKQYFLITNKEVIRYKYLLVIRGLLRNLCLPRTFFCLFLSSFLWLLRTLCCPKHVFV